MPGLRIAARDFVRLLDSGRGISVRRIAKAHGVTEQHVRNRIGAARRLARESAEATAPDPDLTADSPGHLRVIPLFPVGPLTPSSPCPHRGRIPEGSRLYCVVCDQTGVLTDAPQATDPSSAPAASRPRPEPRPRRGVVA